jgi:hypothetical protein
MKKSKVNDVYLEGESHEDYLVRTALEAEKESDSLGYLSSEQAEAIMTKHKHEFFKKNQEAA